MLMHINIHGHTCMHTCLCYVCMYLYVYVFMHVRTYTCMPACSCMCTYMCIHGNTRAHTTVYACSYMILGIVGSYIPASLRSHAKTAVRTDLKQRSQDFDKLAIASARGYSHVCMDSSLLLGIVHMGTVMPYRWYVCMHAYICIHVSLEPLGRGNCMC